MRDGLTLWVRVGAILFAGSAVVVAVLTARLDRPPPLTTVTVNSAPALRDTASAELARCNAMTDPARVDDSCRRVWAEQRRRFFSARETAR